MEDEVDQNIEYNQQTQTNSNFTQSNRKLVQFESLNDIQTAGSSGQDGSMFGIDHSNSQDENQIDSHNDNDDNIMEDGQ